jgi:CheY-like chemotaxis protein
MGAGLAGAGPGRVNDGLVHGTTRIREHCAFAWTEHQWSSGRSARIFEVGSEHCEVCITNLRAAWPQAQFHLPASRRDEGTAPPLKDPNHAAHRSDGSVLVVDDDAEIVDAMTRLLGEAGYSVLTARNGEEAFDVLVRDMTVGLVLLDLSMPVMDGHRFLMHARADARLRDVHVVVITADIRARHASLLCDRVLCKPVDAEHLLDVVEELNTARRRR